MPVVNLEGVSTGFEVLPEGKFRAVFARFKNGVSKARNATVSVEFVINDGEGVELPDGTFKNLGGSKAFRTFAFTDNSLWAFKKALIQLGMPSDDPRLNTVIDSDEVLGELVGAEVMLAVTAAEYDGKPSNNVEIVDDLSW
jgi:hypothetical protein